MSGINRYGIHRPGETLTESSAVSDEGFLGKVSAAWEEAATPEGAGSARGIRTVHLRTGMVLAASGGALKAMLPAFKAGLGGRIGSGRQMISWIRLGDLVSMIVWALEDPKVEGPLNAVAPHPVSQADFARALGRAVHRPAVIPAPAWAVKLLFGQMGAETVLADLAVEPRIELLLRLRSIPVAPGVVGVGPVPRRNPLNAAELVDQVGLAVVGRLLVGVVAEDAGIVLRRQLFL
jgi:uncharacterized protein (TIGR01777 family)